MATKIKEFTRPILRELRNEILEDLADLADRHGLTVELGNASFTDANVTFKLQLATTNPDGTINNKKAEDFRRYAKMMGLEPDDLGKTFQHNRSVFTIDGLKPRSTKFPVLATNQNGKTYKFPVGTILRALGRPSNGHF